MTEEENITVNIDASLMNVQRGDVLLLRVPPEVPHERQQTIAKRIQNMFAVNEIDIQVVILPFDWIPMVIEEGEKEDYGIPDDIIEGDEEDETS